MVVEDRQRSTGAASPLWSVSGAFSALRCLLWKDVTVALFFPPRFGGDFAGCPVALAIPADLLAFLIVLAIFNAIGRS